DRLIPIHETKASLYFLLSDFHNARAEGERVLALARAAGDRVKEATALANIGFASLWAHDFDRALAESEQAMTVARDAGAQAVVAAGLFNTGFVHTCTGRLDEAQEEFTQTLAVSRSTGDVLHEAFVLGFQAGFKNWAGEFEAS